MKEGQSSISVEILGRYAGDAARETAGVHALAGRHPVKVASDEAGVSVEIHLAVDWAASIPEVARDVQGRVREYLQRMADVEPMGVEVVVEEIGPR